MNNNSTEIKDSEFSPKERGCRVCRVKRDWVSHKSKKILRVKEYKIHIGVINSETSDNNTVLFLITEQTLYYYITTTNQVK